MAAAPAHPSAVTIVPSAVASKANRRANPSGPGDSVMTRKSPVRARARRKDSTPRSGREETWTCRSNAFDGSSDGGATPDLDDLSRRLAEMTHAIAAGETIVLSERRISESLGAEAFNGGALQLDRIAQRNPTQIRHV